MKPLLPPIRQPAAIPTRSEVAQAMYRSLEIAARTPAHNHTPVGQCDVLGALPALFAAIGAGYREYEAREMSKRVERWAEDTRLNADQFPD
jgi:hypothetical protein